MVCWKDYWPSVSGTGCVNVLTHWLYLVIVLYLSAYQISKTDIYLYKKGFLKKKILNNTDMYLNATWDYFSWCHPKIIYGKKPCVRNLFTLNHYEEHVASSVIVWGTMLLCSNLFVLSFQGSLHLKRTAATLPFCSDLSTWLSVQWSRKRGPVHVPSDWHVTLIVWMKGTRRKLCL